MAKTCGVMVVVFGAEEIGSSMVTQDESGIGDVHALRHLYAVNPSARFLLDHAATRRNHVRTMSVDTLIETLRRESGVVVGRSELIDALRHLERCGVGQFKVGRRGQPSRFEWDVDIGTVGRAAVGSRDEEHEPRIVERAPIGSEGGNTTPQSSDQAIHHTYQLRPNFVVSIDLPANLTSREAGRISDFVKTLPFDDGGSI